MREQKAPAQEGTKKGNDSGKSEAEVIRHETKVRRGNMTVGEARDRSIGTKQRTIAP